LILEQLRAKNPISSGELYSQIRSQLDCGYTTFHQALVELERDGLIVRSVRWNTKSKGLTSIIFLGPGEYPVLERFLGKASKLEQALVELTHELRSLKQLIIRQNSRATGVEFSIRSRLASLEHRIQDLSRRSLETCPVCGAPLSLDGCRCRNCGNWVCEL